MDLNSLNKKLPSSNKKPVPNIINPQGNVEGWLIKRGTSGALASITYNRRYFKQINNRLYYFDSSAAEKPRGYIDLDTVYSVDIVTTPLFGFTLSCKDKTITLRASSHAERVVWVEALRDRCPNARKEPNTQEIQEIEYPTASEEDAFHVTNDQHQGTASSPAYDMPPPSYDVPPPSYDAPPPAYDAPPPAYDAPPPPYNTVAYDAPPPVYQAQQNATFSYVMPPSDDDYLRPPD